MSPTLHDGDIVLVRFGATPRPGDVVLVGWPARPGQLSVKRAVRPERDGWWVLRRQPVRLDRLARPGPRPGSGRGARAPLAPARPPACVRQMTPIPAIHAVPSSCTRPPTPVRRPPAARSSGGRPARAGPYPWPRCATIRADRTQEAPLMTLLNDLQPSLDEIFAAHEGGKLATGLERRRWPTPVTSPSPTRPGSRRSAGPSPPSPRSPAATPGPTASSPSSATAPPCSASATSVPARRSP